MLAVADEDLAAVDDVAIPIFFGCGADGFQVAARAGLGHANRRHRVAADHARQPIFALRLGATVQQVGRDDVVVHLQSAHKAAIAPAREHLHHGEREVHAGPRAAVLLGHVGTEVAVLAHLAEQLAVDEARLFPVAVMGLDLAIAKALQRFGEDLQFGFLLGREECVGKHSCYECRSCQRFLDKRWRPKRLKLFRR